MMTFKQKKSELTNIVSSLKPGGERKKRGETKRVSQKDWVSPIYFQYKNR